MLVTTLCLYVTFIYLSKFLSISVRISAAKALKDRNREPQGKGVSASDTTCQFSEIL